MNTIRKETSFQKNILNLKVRHGKSTASILNMMKITTWFHLKSTTKKIKKNPGNISTKHLRKSRNFAQKRDLNFCTVFYFLKIWLTLKQDLRR